ncbi:protein kinase [Parendozoicomonas sp. Alg238-R29]|uniref:protein kinase domain-containing protein n=1 Tax=Parendozoicomonas sp. Alg238-R29 TaxID=2993446 RepID=UPI00248D4021|nr:protein kinase [Parendozoicomonas sp. Alg238-R29]
MQINGSEYSFFKPLGQGFYGSVQQVTCLDQTFSQESDTPPATNMFAMKMIPRKEPGAEADSKEVGIMSELKGCHYIVGALGTTTDDQYEYILMPDAGGNLASLTQSGNSAGVYINTRKRRKALNVLDKILERMSPRDGSFHALSEEMARKVFRGMLEGIHFMHEKEIVHRDIKPSNILVGQNGTGRLADFGAAAHLSDKPSEGGDGRFSPPERSSEAGSYTKASDIWMAGACMAATAISPAAVYTRRNKPRSTEEIRANVEKADISGDLKRLLLLMLQDNPALRPGAKELLSEPFFMTIQPL